MSKKSKIFFGLIILLAALTRFWRLGSLPSGLNWDEISHGYNAYSLLKTGRDQWNQAWPVFNFRAYGDYPTAGNLYFTLPFVYLFGLNSFSIRLPAAIFGLLFVIAVYYFSNVIFKNRVLSLISMFLAAVSPWALFPSRAVFQSNLSQFFLVLGTYFFFRGLKKSKSLIFAALFLSVSTYTYHNARIIVPLLILTLVIFYHRRLLSLFKKDRLALILSAAVLLLILLPNLINLISPTSLARNRWVGIINPNSINLINENRRLFNGPAFLNLALNNKITYFSKTLALNFLNLLNPAPIFFRGSENFQFNPPATGLIFAVFLPFFYFGLYLIIKKSLHHPQFLLLLLLFLINLLPAALTIGDFPSVRATSALPYYFIFIAFGLVNFRPYLRRILIFFIVLISLANLFTFFHKYLAYDRDYSSAWQYGYQQAVNYVHDNYRNYRQIVFTKKYGEPHEFVLFYWPWDPASFQHDPSLKWDFHADWYWVNAFADFRFVNDWDIKTFDYPSRTLLVTSPGNYPPDGFRLLKTINFLNGRPAFEILAHD